MADDFMATWRPIQPSIRLRAFKLGGIYPVVCGPDDLYQEAWFGAYESWDKVKHLDHRTGALITIAHRKMIEAIRRVAGRSGQRRLFAEDIEAAIDLEEPHGRPDAWLEAKETLAALMARCSGREQHMKVLKLLIDGLTNTEIAGELSIDPSRVSQICIDMKRAVLGEDHHRFVVELPVPDPQPQVDWQIESLREVVTQQIHDIERWK